jgi:hypothetical protein
MNSHGGGGGLSAESYINAREQEEGEGITRFLTRLIGFHTFQQQENKYREGSPLFSMHDLIASSMTIVDGTEDRSLTPTQRQIMQILKLNKDQLEVHEVCTSLPDFYLT